jgi:TRAP-type uncharacterized transport system fused permease subunit
MTMLKMKKSLAQKKQTPFGTPYSNPPSTRVLSYIIPIVLYILIIYFAYNVNDKSAKFGIILIFVAAVLSTIIYTSFSKQQRALNFTGRYVH